MLTGTVARTFQKFCYLSDAMNDEDLRHKDAQKEIVKVRHSFEQQEDVKESKAAEQAAQTQELMRTMTELLGKKEGWADPRGVSRRWPGARSFGITNSSRRTFEHRRRCRVRRGWPPRGSTWREWTRQRLRSRQ